MINIGTIKIKTWNIEAMTGYKPRTTFYEDFSIADHFGASAVRDTYCRAFNAWQNNIEYMTELVMVLNWKIWEHKRMKQNIFTKHFKELTADELLHLMDMISEECVSHRHCEECKLFECCGFHSEVPSEWYTMSIKKIVEAFREENR